MRLGARLTTLDVTHYDLRLSYPPRTRALTAHAAIEARSLQGLRGFNLDLRDLDVSAVRPGDPGPSDVFAAAVHQRGAMTLQALRTTIGDDAFAKVLRQWAGGDRDRPVGTDDFRGLAETVSGEDLDALFRTWPYTPGEPAAPNPA